MSAVDPSMTAGLMGQARDAYTAGRQAGLPGVTKDMSRTQIKQAAQDFESFFLAQMFQPMFETVGTDPLFGGGPGEEVWKSMMVDQMAKQVAAKGGLGIADDVMKVMIQAQEAAQ